MCHLGVINKACVVAGREVLGHPCIRLHPTMPCCCSGNIGHGPQTMWQAHGHATTLSGVQLWQYNIKKKAIKNRPGCMKVQGLHQTSRHHTNNGFEFETCLKANTNNFTKFLCI